MQSITMLPLTVKIVSGESVVPLELDITVLIYLYIKKKKRDKFKKKISFRINNLKFERK